MKSVGGDEPMAAPIANGPTRVTDAVRGHEQPSFPLTPTDRQSVEEDLEQQQRLLARHANTEPLAGRLKDWSDRYHMFAREIARLERQLEEDGRFSVHQALGRCRCGECHTIDEAIALNTTDAA